MISPSLYLHPARGNQDRPSLQSISFELTKTNIESKECINSLTYTVSLQEVDNHSMEQLIEAKLEQQEEPAQNKRNNLFRKRTISHKHPENLQKQNLAGAKGSASKIKIELSQLYPQNDRLISDRLPSIACNKQHRSKTMMKPILEHLTSPNSYLKNHHLLLAVCPNKKIGKTFPQESEFLSTRPAKRMTSLVNRRQKQPQHFGKQAGVKLQELNFCLKTKILAPANPSKKRRT